MYAVADGDTLILEGVAGVVKRMKKIFENVGSDARFVIVFGLMYSVAILFAALLLAIVNHTVLMDIEITHNTVLLAECGVAVLPFCVGGGLMLDYWGKKKQ